MITKRERLQKALKHLRNSLTGKRGEARAVLLFGEQRSGTNMLLDCFRASPQTAVFNETDDDAFDAYELRDLAVIRQLILRSPASHVVFKPTADGNRALEIIESLGGSRSVWIYRNYKDAVTSALALFEETSLQYLQKVADQSPEARWRATALLDEDRALIRGHLDRGISEASARALIWYLRNSFYFRQQLDQRSDCLLVKYEDLVTNPAVVVARVFDFVGLAFKSKFVAKVFASSIGRRPPPEIDPQIDELCAALTNRFNQAA